MPGTVIAAAIAGLASGTAGFISTGLFTLSAFATGFVTTLVVGVASKALMPKPKQPQGATTDMGNRTVTVRAPAAYREVIYGRVRKGGTIVFLHSTDNNGGKMWLFMDVAFAGHECNAIETIYADDYAMTFDLPLADNFYQGENGRYATRSDTPIYALDPDGQTAETISTTTHYYANVTPHYGSLSQPADDFLINHSAGMWTSAHRLAGICHISLEFTHQPNMFPNGAPNPSAIIQGKRVYDPRTGLTVWSDNCALCVADYLCDATYGFGETYSDGIDIPALIAAANICDELVLKADGTYEKRYTCNGYFSSDIEPQEVLAGLLSSMAGKAVQIGETWKIYAGAYRAATVALDEDDFLSLKVNVRMPRSELFNSVKGTYIDPNQSWQETSFAGVQSASSIAEDGAVIWKDVALPWTTSASMAQRLAKIDLMRIREQISVQARCRLAAYMCQPGDTVQVTVAHYGWTAKEFEVIQTELSMDEGGEMTVDLLLRETASNIYDWDEGEEQPPSIAPNTSLPDPFAVPTPSGLTVTESQYVTRDGTSVRTLARLDWSIGENPYVTQFQVVYRPFANETAEAWTWLPLTGAPSYEIEDFETGDFYFAVRSISYQGAYSDWTILRKQIIGTSADPVALTNFQVVNMGGLALLSWDQSSDLDVRVGGSIYIRHHPSTSGSPTWAEATQIGSPVLGGEVMAIVPLKLGTYMIRAYDNGGRVGPIASFSTEGATILAYSTLDTLTEHTTFSGTKTGTVVSAGVLSLDSTGNFSAIPLLSAVPSVASYGGIEPEGSYAFNTTMNLGSLRRVRVRSHILATITSVVDTVGSRLAFISTWPSFVGLDGDEADAWVEFRDTATDPTGSPTWTEWRRLDASEIRAWGLQFRLQLRSYDANYNIEISELSAVAENI